MDNGFTITISGLKELAEAVDRLAAAVSGRAGGAPVQGTGAVQAPPVQTAPSAQQAASFQTAYGLNQPGAMPGMNAGQPMPLGGGHPAGAVVPTTAMPQGYTLEQLQVAAAGLTSMGKMPQVMGILQQFGIQAMTELPKERYGEFAAALREAGAQV